ncbi:hypothetical protein HDV06_006818 [Boothiomyces sp. JEL0866]|nr:hypothetical protein HDV06_006818 [Boothiomyces sp. JEL0866]
MQQNNHGEGRFEIKSIFVHSKCDEEQLAYKNQLKLVEKAVVVPIQYSMTLRQSPTQGIAVAEDKDKYRKILEPPTIVQVYVPERKQVQDYHFAVAVLVDIENQKEMHFLDDGTTPILSGCTKSSIHQLIDPEDDSTSDYGSFLIFPDIYVRKEGHYKLKVVLYKMNAIVDPYNPYSKVTKETEILTDTFHIQPVDYGDSNKYMRVTPSVLSRSFAEQGVKMKLRRQPRSKWVVDYPQVELTNRKRVLVGSDFQNQRSELQPHSKKVSTLTSAQPVQVESAPKSNRPVAVANEEGRKRPKISNSTQRRTQQHSQVYYDPYDRGENVAREDKKQLEPAAIVELTLSEVYNEGNSYQAFLFATAVLLDAESLKELYFLEDQTTSILTGSTSSSVHHLLDPDKDLSPSSFLIFPDISVRKEGRYKLKIILFKIEGGSQSPLSTERKVLRQDEIITDTFEVLKGSALKKKKLPPTPLSRSFSQQGIKMKLKRQPRSNWIIENVDNSPPPKRRAQDSEGPDGDSEKKKVRAARLAKSKVIDTESDENEVDIQTKESPSLSSKITKSRLSDLLNFAKEDSNIPSRNYEPPNIARIKHFESTSPNARAPVVENKRSLANQSISTSINERFENYRPPHSISNEYYSPYNSMPLPDVSGHRYPANHREDYRAPHLPELSTRFRPADVYRDGVSPNPRLPPIHTLPSHHHYPPVPIEHDYSSEQYRRYPPNSPYWRYWQNLNYRPYDYSEKDGRDYRSHHQPKDTTDDRAPFHPDNYYARPRPHNPN